jgi:hypothetical protein
MSAPANSRECILELRGRNVVGVLQSGLPLNRPDLSLGTTTIIFDDGSGLSFTGAFWTESKNDVEAALANLRRRMEEAGALAADALRIAGQIRQGIEP